MTWHKRIDRRKLSFKNSLFKLKIYNLSSNKLAGKPQFNYLRLFNFCFTNSHKRFRKFFVYKFAIVHGSG